ncbi:hypothetical protein AB0912_22265 [Streptomyces sp. NPDC007084]|uniref:hypothetical protein n=1 Tax=Streptomyces sp. NPDC007084 TaxID=3154313 RepID=UPI00345657C5
MTGGSFEGDPAQLRDFMARLEGVSANARAIAEDMIEGLRPNTSWYGIDDEYAQSAGPQYKRTIETLVETLGALGQAVEGINAGRRAEIYKITGTSNWAQEQVAELQGKTDEIGNEHSGGGRGH